MANVDIGFRFDLTPHTFPDKNSVFLNRKLISGSQEAEIHSDFTQLEPQIFSPYLSIKLYLISSFYVFSSAVTTMGSNGKACKINDVRTAGPPL